AGLSAVLTTAAAPGAPAHVLASVSAAALVPAPGDMAWVIAQAVLRTRLMASARIAGVLLLVSIAVVGALLVLDTSPPSVPEASAQTAPMGESPPLSPNEITLVGLRADGDDVLLDASGNTIGLLPDWDQAIDQWNADS